MTATRGSTCSLMEDSSNAHADQWLALPMPVMTSPGRSAPPAHRLVASLRRSETEVDISVAKVRCWILPTASSGTLTTMGTTAEASSRSLMGVSMASMREGVRGCACRARSLPGSDWEGVGVVAECGTASTPAPARRESTEALMWSERPLISRRAGMVARTGESGSHPRRAWGIHTRMMVELEALMFTVWPVSGRVRRVSPRLETLISSLETTYQQEREHG